MPSQVKDSHPTPSPAVTKHLRNNKCLRVAMFRGNVPRTHAVVEEKLIQTFSKLPQKKMFIS